MSSWRPHKADMHPGLWLIVIVSGAAGQFLDSLAGMGFGALSSTIMLSGGIAPAVVIGVVNIAKVGSGLVSGLSHWRFGNVRWPWVLPMLAPALAGGVIAALIVTSIPEETIRLVVPVVLMLMGLLILYRFLWAKPILTPVAGGSGEYEPAVPRGFLRTPTQRLTSEKPITAVWLGVIGFIGGFLNGLSGAFGPFTTSAMLLKQMGHPRFAIGTVNFVEVFVAGAVAATLILRATSGDWHWGLPLALMAGSIVTAPIGAYLSRRLPARVVGVFVGFALIALNTWSLARAII
jgi:uncharacterized membrane protein YfcA